MTDEGAAESWIGEEVLIHTISRTEFVAILKGLKDYGFLYTNLDSDTLILMPWSAILWMRPAGEEAEFYRS